jgi:hypothetical protein
MIPLTKQDLRDLVAQLPADYKRVTPFPKEWELPPHQMIRLIDERVIGMDGFQYQFVEYARQCRETCRRAQGLL